MSCSSLRRFGLRGRRVVAVATVAPLLALGALAAPATAQTAPASATAQTVAAPPDPCPAAVPISDVTAGLTGTGYTVSSGTKPEPFTAQVIGVLKDGIAPGLDMIIVKTDSPAIQAAGGIWAGMSGSPVYTSDGRLLGAIAYGLSGAPSSIGGITPAGEMLNVLHFTSAASPQLPARVSLPKSLQERIADTGAASAAQAAGGMSQLRMPLAISGLAGQHFDRVAHAITRSKLFAALPFRAGAASSAPANPAKITPGGNFAAALSYGDVTFAGVGTTTAVCHGVALAFGHPFTFGGKVALSVHTANALYVQPDNLFGPYKVANLGGVAGTVDQDRLAAIRAPLGAGPVPIKVTSTVSAAGTGLTRTGTTFVNMDADLPTIAALHLLANFDRTFQKIGEGTSLVTWTVTGKTSAGTSFKFTRTNRFASQFDVSFESIFEMLSFLSQIQEQPLVDVHFSKVTITASEQELFRQYRIDKVLQKTGTNTYVEVNSRRPIRVRAGGSVRLRVRLAPFRNRGPARNFDFTYRIPTNRAGSSGAFKVVGGASSFFGNSFCLFEPGACGGGGGATKFSQILKALGRQPRNDQLIATMIIGPSPRKSGSKPVVTKQVRIATQVVTGARFIPVKVTR
jgi:SpoIVB peptidase S55